jgi:nucleotide-binding universal stress UspA family protein
VKPFRHVVVATDFSECSNAAVDAAIELAKRYDAGLTLVHVVEIPTYAYAGAEWMPLDMTPVHEAAHEAMERALTEAQKRMPSARAKLESTGPAWQRIIAVARDLGADLIVLGTHGRTGIKHALIGSVAERVVRHSHIPVLTIGACRPRHD